MAPLETDVSSLQCSGTSVWCYSSVSRCLSGPVSEAAIGGKLVRPVAGKQCQQEVTNLATVTRK